MLVQIDTTWERGSQRSLKIANGSLFSVSDPCPLSFLNKVKQEAVCVRWFVVVVADVVRILCVVLGIIGYAPYGRS